MRGAGTGGGARSVALPAMLSALALVLLYGACITPSGAWGVTAAAGLCPMAVVASLGLKSGFLCWSCVSLLALLFLPNQFYAVLFALLFGLYPMIKALAERCRRFALRYAAKLAFFNAVLTVLLAVMRVLTVSNLPVWLTQRVWLLYLMGSLLFVIYDIGLTRLIRFYLIRVDRVLRRGG